MNARKYSDNKIKLRRENGGGVGRYRKPIMGTELGKGNDSMHFCSRDFFLFNFVVYEAFVTFNCIGFLTAVPQTPTTTAHFILFFPLCPSL